MKTAWYWCKVRKTDQRNRKPPNTPMHLSAVDYWVKDKMLIKYVETVYPKQI
jgi:hypothetical protein